MSDERHRYIYICTWLVVYTKAIIRHVVRPHSTQLSLTVSSLSTIRHQGANLAGFPRVPRAARAPRGSSNARLLDVALKFH